ncbi:MAG TPA: PAS domain S-box protein, partial [Acidobacteriota bacterium]
MRGDYSAGSAEQKPLDNTSAGAVRLLYVGADSKDLDLTLKHFALSAPNFSVKTATSISEALPLGLRDHDCDIVLAEMKLPDGTAIDLLTALRQNGIQLPFVIVTGKADEKIAATALELGVSDYIVKRDGYLSQLPFVIQNALQRSRLQQMNQQLREELRERDHVREALEATETKYRNIIERIPVVIYIADFGFDGSWYYVSPRIEVLLGFTAEELMQDAGIWSRQIHPDDLNKVRSQAARTHDTGQPFLCEYRIFTRSGNLRWVRDEAVAVYDSSGSPLYLQGVLSEITDVKLAEEALREQAEYLAALHDTALGIMSRKNLKDLLHLIVTRACTRSENTGGFVYLVEPNDASMCLRVGTGQSEPYTGTYIHRGEGVTGKVWKSGQPMVVNNYNAWPGRLRSAGFESFHAVAGVPIKSNDKVIGVLGVESTDPDRKFSDHDVKLLEGFTELASIAIDNELAHKRLEEQEELFRVILENIPAMVGIVEPNLQLKWVNRQFEQNLGWTLLEAQQSFFKEAFADPESRKEAIQFLQQADAKWRDFEIHLRDGRVSQVACASVRLSDGNLIVIGQDVTERLVAEKNRRQMEEQLRQIQKIEAIGRLAGGVAHDFNNLLMVITGYSELLMMQTAESDHRHKMLSEIYRAAEQGADLTRQLLAFSRKQVLEPKILDLNEVIREIGNMVGRLIGEDIQLVTRLHAKRSRITADQNQLHQVIMNLAVNARDAMPTGGTLMLETSSIEFRGPGESLAVSPPAGFYVQLLVRDTGEGMDESTQARIFEPFFTTKEKG